ncbi:MAG: (2Fe-2S)-binding protein [Bacteroidales bacterium]
MAKFKLKINRKVYQVDVDPSTPILWVLRDNLGLVGTKYGCGQWVCGACTIHLDDEAVPACKLLVSEVGKKAITTIEGLSENGDHPIQKAWLAHDVSQCGYCQPGQIMRVAALLKKNPNPTDKEIEVAMEHNICRCGTYMRINAAIKTVVNTR